MRDGPIARRRSGLVALALRCRLPPARSAARHLRSQCRQAAGGAPIRGPRARRRTARHARSRQQSHPGAHRPPAARDARRREMAGRLPLVVQARLTQTSKTPPRPPGHRQPGAATDYTLALDIRSFELDVPGARVTSTSPPNSSRLLAASSPPRSSPPRRRSPRPRRQASPRRWTARSPR